MIHFILFSIIVFAFLIRKYSNLQWLPFFVLALIASIRYMYGNDYASYFRWYQIIKAGGRSPFGEEILYTCLNKISPSFYVLILITSLFFIFIVYELITRNLKAKYIWIALSVFLVNPYLFLVNLSAIRQCIAMCFFVIAVELAIKKKYIGYIGCIVIATLFHKSAVILLPVILLVNDKKVDVIKVVSILIGVLFFLNFDGFVSIIENIASNFQDMNYLHYINKIEGNSVRATILSSLYFVYVLFNLPRLEGRYLIYGKLYLLSPILAVLAYKISMLTRLQMYFDVYSVIVIPYLLMTKPRTGKIAIYRNDDRKTIWELFNRYVLPCLIILIYMLRYYSFFKNPTWSSHFSNYRTILDLL